MCATRLNITTGIREISDTHNLQILIVHTTEHGSLSSHTCKDMELLRLNEHANSVTTGLEKNEEHRNTTDFPDALTGPGQLPSEYNNEVE